MKRLSGKEIKPLLLEELKKDPLLPSLSFYLYGPKEDYASLYYLKGIKRTLDSLSIPYTEGFLDLEKTKDENLKIFKKESLYRFAIVARPLPVPYEKEFLELLNPDYDPDMMTTLNLGKLYQGDLDYLPATVLSVKTILSYYQIDLKGKKVLVLGRSLTVGKPLGTLALKQNAFVSIAHSKVDAEYYNSITKDYDCIFLATGKSGLIQRSSFRPNQIVIDCGFNPQGGDLGFVPEENELSQYTPVPGGVGVLTSLCLVKNALTLKRNQKTR